LTGNIRQTDGQSVCIGHNELISLLLYESVTIC